MNFEKNFLGNGGFYWFFGIVEDRNDPLEAGRVRARCMGIHTADRALLPTEDLPWAMVMQSTSDPSMTGIGDGTFLVEGSFVFGFFMDGEEAQHPMIIGSMKGIPLEKLQKTVGFSDPAGKYPLWLNEPDLNKLSRGDPTAPQAQSRISNRMVSVPTVTSSWDEPLFQLQSVYPYNHQRVTESGHAFEMDDTTDQERIHIFHKSGSFSEFTKDGDSISKAARNTYALTFGDKKEYVQGQLDLTVGAGAELRINAIGGSGLKILVDNVGNMEITVEEGDLTFRVNNGNLNKYVNGDLNESVTGNYNRMVMGSINDTSATAMVKIAPTITLN